MSIDDSQRLAGLEKRIDELDHRISKLETLLDENDHTLFEEWFKHFLDDKCHGGW